MVSLLLAFLVGCSQGLVHGLGPDHCAALVTLGLGAEGRRAALRTALRFAIGHALSLAGLSALCLGLGVALSENFERRAEVAGGAMLVALALAVLLFPGALQHGHPHPPGHAHRHRHARIASTAGALLAVSGARALLMALAPLLVGGGLRFRGLAYLPGFALGVFLSMGTLGWLLSAGRSALRPGTVRAVQRFAAATSGAVGIWWMVQHA